MPTLTQKVKEAFTPKLHHTVSTHSALITILWISLVILSLGYALCLFSLYMRVLRLEDAVRVLGAA